MLYKYTSRDGNTKLVEAQHKGHAAAYVASQEFELDKVTASDAIKLSTAGVKVEVAPAPQARAK